MKKINAFALLISLIIWLLNPLIVLWADEERYFVVTAYYSPLPNQNNYLRGDYEKEKILNGEWIQWASWKKVFSWMLAAPKWYNFWTKIYLEWVWVWSVEDRGGAIVKAWERWHKYDRIDIWVGYGDDGLKRALAWWKRTVKWKILNSTSKTTIDVGDFHIPKTLNLKNNRYSYGPSVFQKSIWIDSNSSDIKELQKILKKSWLYEGDEDWVYSQKMIDAVYNFQKQYSIVTSSKDAGAGYWGIKTRKKFASLYNGWVFTWGTLQSKDITKEKDIFETYISPNSSEENIKKLQGIIKEIWIYSWEINGNYNDIKSIMISYQIDSGIIKNKTDIAAWHFWPKTRAKIKEDYTKLLAKKQQEEEHRKMIESLTKKSIEEADKIVKNIGNIAYWETSKWVRELQIILKDLWYFDYKDTAIFWKITKESIVRYQLENEIIKTENENVAWLVWPKTKESLKEDIANLLLEENLKQLDPNEIALK